MMMSQGNTVNALASLRAAAETRQFYNQALLNHLAGPQQPSSFLSQDLLGLRQSAGSQGLPPSASDMILAAARNSQNGGSVNPALLAAAAASAGKPSATGGANSSLTRQYYLQMLQNRQDMAISTGVSEGGTNDSKSPAGGDGESASNSDRYDR